MLSWLESAGPVVAFLTGLVGLASAIASTLISIRTLARVRKEERLREEAAAHQKVQSEALLKALFGIDEKLNEHASAIAEKVERQMQTHREQLVSLMSDLIQESQRSQADKIKAKKLLYQNQVEPAQTSIKETRLVLSAVSKAIRDLTGNRAPEDVKKDLRVVTEASDSPQRKKLAGSLEEGFSLLKTLWGLFAKSPAPSTQTTGESLAQRLKALTTSLELDVKRAQEQEERARSQIEQLQHLEECVAVDPRMVAKTSREGNGVV